MLEIVAITYIDEDPIEMDLVERAKMKIESLGRICLVSTIYLDEYGADGSSPIIEFSDGTMWQGSAEILAHLEQPD